MRRKLIYLSLLFLASLYVGCSNADVEEQITLDTGEGDYGYEIGDPLIVNAYDANSTTKTLEDDAQTHFTKDDKIGIFVVIGEYIIQFNECYTMNSEGNWIGEGAYWGDSNSDVHYYAYYPYMNDICFDDIYRLTEGEGGFSYISETDAEYLHVTGNGTGTVDGSVPSQNNDFTADANGYPRPDNNRMRSTLEEGVDDDPSEFSAGANDLKYVLHVDYDTVTPGVDDDKDDGTRTAAYFFNDIVDKWTPRTYQAGTGYTLSDLMICKGSFSQTSVGTYPLTLVLRHQMSMMHYEFPSKYLFYIGTDGKGDRIAVEGDDSPAYNPTSDEAEDANRATLSIYIDPVTKTTNTLGDIVVAGITDLQAKFHDLTKDTGSVYEGGNNEFRYIMRPHSLYEQSLFDDVAGYSGSQIHIKYSYMNKDDEGNVVADADGDYTINKTFNTAFNPQPNAYVHYLMDDGAIPSGDPTTIRTAGDDHNNGKYPTCVGAFWRHNQSGERIIKIQPSFAEDCGDWRAFVYQMDAGWNNTTDIRLSSDVTSVYYGATDAEDYQVTTISQSVSGTCTLTKPILFRIGLTDEDFNMTSPVSGEYLPARYATVMLIYGDGEKYQLLYLRQGEDPDYVYHPEDTYESITGADIQRFYASKVSAFNLSVDSWLTTAEGTTTTTAGAVTSNTYVKSTTGGVATATYSNATLTKYPSQVGAYTLPAVRTSCNTSLTGTYQQANQTRWIAYYKQLMFPATSTTAINTDTSNSSGGYYIAPPVFVWDELQEVCPKGVASADETRTFDYARPEGGRTTLFIETYNGTMSQFGQSLFADPLSDATNCIAGYYADGFHDRRNFDNIYFHSQYSSTGVLFYNPRDFASVFLPAGGRKTSGGAAISAVSNPTTAFPACPEYGGYWTKTSIYSAQYLYFKVNAQNNYGDDTTPVTATAASCEPKTGATEVSAWYSEMYNIRPFVEDESIVDTE